MFFYPFFPEKKTESVLPPLSQVGGKGLSLIQSSNNGFPVPKGFILAVDFFQPWIDVCMDEKKNKAWKRFAKKARIMQEDPNDCKENNMEITKEDCDELKIACSKKIAGDQNSWFGPRKNDGCHFTQQQEDSLREAIQSVFGGDKGNESILVAVRSSSPEEDLFGTSFAGGYDTTLGVPLCTGESEDIAEFAKALLTSFLSMFDYRIVQYKLQQQEKLRRKKKSKTNDTLAMNILEPKIAIVVQEQIDSQISGVAFSINPHNNCYDEIVITANFGLGESVVSGIVSPDVYTVEHGYNYETKEDEFVILNKKIGSKQEVIWLNKEKNSGNGRTVGTIQNSSQNPSEEAALSENQILELARLVAKVEDTYSHESSSFCPIDIEWAFYDGALYLLQARPVTSYIPLFPEMITPRGSAKKNLYLDLIVMTQGFSEPFSTLGLDVWDTMLLKLKPNMWENNGPTGAVWSLHGRQYTSISNLLKTTGGYSTMVKMYGSYDPSIGRAFDSIDFEEYTPLEVPAGVRGFLWRNIQIFGGMVSGIISDWWSGNKPMSRYQTFSEGLIANQDSKSHDSSFRSHVDTSATLLNEALLSMAGSLMMAMWSKYRLEKMFENTKSKSSLNEDHSKSNIDDLLVSLCMDLKGNPTSEMGHAMVQLAGRPEIISTQSADEFCQKLANGNYSSEFMDLYNNFMLRYGCRGMKEIDIASPRTSEEPGVFFQKLKQIDPENNAIYRVQERRMQAHEKLLAIAKTLGKENNFKYYDDIIQNRLGYREHPKYMLVVMNAMFRKHALTIGEEFVREGRMDSREQIFDLTIDQVARAQGESIDDNTVTKDLRPWIRSNTHQTKLVEHISNWPLLIDSRGKIIRGTHKRNNEGEQDDVNVILGDPIAPGKIQGRAKVLMEPYEKPLESGEVLVARFTEPSWTPIFINASAVVMEVGGPLQHGAIIAREYGIPCISGISNATKLIQDGDFIEVDGSSGTVKFIEKDSDKK